MSSTINSKNKITTAPTHPEYDFVADALEDIRICMQGSLAVKKSTYRLLPHPSQIETSTPEQIARYLEYIANAEYKNDGAETKRQMIGKMRLDDTQYELPDSLQYLEQNVDGDSLTLSDCIKNAIGESLEMKVCFLVSDFQGLSDVDLTELSLAEQNELNPRAYIKTYTRDSLTNWSFKTINGVRQLSYMQFRELGTEFDPESGQHTDVESYLILALDDDGNYYQQKKVYGAKGKSEGERNYVSVRGAPLKYIPVSIVSDEPLKSGMLPLGMGFLYPVIQVSLQRYRMSAKYKETQSANIPTRWSKGWQQGDLDIFKEVNQRDYQVTGGYGSNNYPNGVEVGVSSASADMGDFHWDFERYDKEVAALGGNNENGKASNMTATESSRISNNENALLESLAMSAEQAIRRAIAYCGVFMGTIPADNISDSLENITVDLPRDFAKPKLTVEEVRALTELRMQGAISLEEMHKQLKNGGWIISEVDEMLLEMENEGPRLNLRDVVE